MVIDRFHSKYVPINCVSLPPSLSSAVLTPAQHWLLFSSLLSSQVDKNTMLLSYPHPLIDWFLSWTFFCFLSCRFNPSDFIRHWIYYFDINGLSLFHSAGEDEMRGVLSSSSPYISYPKKASRKRKGIRRKSKNGTHSINTLNMFLRIIIRQFLQIVAKWNWVSLAL